MAAAVKRGQISAKPPPPDGATRTSFTGIQFGCSGSDKPSCLYRELQPLACPRAACPRVKLLPSKIREFDPRSAVCPEADRSVSPGLALYDLSYHSRSGVTQAGRLAEGMLQSVLS